MSEKCGDSGGNIFSKGTELDILAKNLVECSYDDDEITRDVIQQSLISLGFKEPNLILSLILAFLRGSLKNKKVPVGQRVVLLTIMKEVLKSKVKEFSDRKDFITDVIKQLVEEMTFTKDIVPDWQVAVCEVIVILSSDYCKEIMVLFTEKIQPSVLPHIFIIQTMGSMANNNPYDMVPYLSGIITQILTLMSLAKTDNYRWVIANCLSQFCEAILEYVANPDRAKDPNITLSVFDNYMFSAFEIFINSWIKTNEPKLRKAVMDAIGNMVFVIQRSNFETHFSKLLSIVFSQYKKHSESYHVTKTLAQILQAAIGQYSSSSKEETETETESNVESPSDITEKPLIVECAPLTNELDQIMNALFIQLQHSLDQMNSGNISSQNQLNAVRNQNEVKRGFTALCVSYPEAVISTCLHKLGVSGTGTTGSGSSSNVNEKVQVAALTVLRHVVSSCDYQVQDKRYQLLAGLRQLIGTNESSFNNLSNNVKIQLAHVIIAMGGQGYLSDTGGLSLVEFIVRQCALPSKSESTKTRKIKLGGGDDGDGQINNERLRSFCENVIHLGSSTVPCMKPVLWPFLMELVVPIQYTNAVGTICSAIENLFSLSSETNENSRESNNTDADDGIDPIIDYDVCVNIPGPQFLMSRLIVLAGVPLKNNMRGIHILQAMKILVINFHENLSDIWNLIIPKLLLYLNKTLNSTVDDDDSVPKFEKLQWEELMLKLIAKSIEHINDEDWTCELGEAFGQHISLYEKLSEEKGFLFKCLGTVMANSTKKVFIEKHLDLIFHSTKHSEPDERLGFAVAFGVCSASHIDVVLSKLEFFFKQDSKKSGFMNLLKDRSDGDKELIRASILLGFANSVFYAPRTLVTSRLESSVVKVVHQSLKHSKNQVVNRLVVESIDFIARSVNYSKIGHNYKLDIRNDLVTALLGYIEAEPTGSIYSEIRYLTINTIGNLIVLPPSITDVEMHRILSVCIGSVFHLPPDGIPVKKSKETAFEEAQNLTKIMNKTLTALNNLFVIILKTFYSNMTFNELYKVIQDRVASEHEYVRERALQTLNVILSCYYQELKETKNEGVRLNSIGTILGDIIPRLADVGFTNRQLTVDCVILILQIQMKLDIGRDAINDSSMTLFTSVKERLRKFDSNIVFGAVNDLCKTVAKHIDVQAIEPLLNSLYRGLTDQQKHGSSSVCVMLNALFRARYSDLSGQIPIIIGTLHDILPKLVDNPKTGVLRAIKVISSQYLIETLNSVMSQTLPLDDVWAEILCTSINDETLLDKTLVHLMELMARSMPYEERDDPTQRKVKGQPQKVVRYPCHVWLAAVNCLQLLMSENISCCLNCINKVYNKLFTSMVLACGSMVICSPFTGKSHEKKSGMEANLHPGTHPISIAKGALKNFLVISQSHEIIEDINIRNGWEKIENEEEFMEFINILAKSVCENKSSEIYFIINQLNQHANSNYEQHRLLITGFFGSVIDTAATLNTITLDNLIDTIIVQLITRLGDKALEVRRLALIGIGNVSRCSDPIIKKHATSLLSALLMGMDDRHDNEDKLINAAMDGLSFLVDRLKEPDVREVLVTICLRMLSCYERESPSVRASAFRLFGALARLATGPSHSRYICEVNSVIVPLFVHLEDPSGDVVRACKAALKQVVPLYVSASLSTDSNALETNASSSAAGASVRTESNNTILGDSNGNKGNKLNEFIQACFQREDGSLHYGEFCNDLAKLILVEMPDKMNDLIMRAVVFFKSDYPELAASSVLLTGFLMRHLPENQRKELQKGQICVELIHLMRSKNAKVRARTAEAISLLDVY